MPGIEILAPEERAAGLLFRETFRSRNSVEKGGATLVGTGTTFGPDGMTLSGSGNLLYNVSMAKITRSGMTIVFDFTWGEAINNASQRVWFGSGSLQWLMFKLAAAGSHVLDIYFGGTRIFNIGYATWSAAVVAGKNTFVISAASGANSIWLNGVLLQSTATVWAPSAPQGFALGAYTGGTTPVVGTFHRFEIYGFACTAVDEPYLRQGTLISKLDDYLVAIPGTSYYKRASDGLYVTDVLGKAGITQALMGSDGATAAQFPKVAKEAGLVRGFGFDGGDQINLGDSDALSFTDGVADKPFSVACLCTFTDFSGLRGIYGKSVTITNGEYTSYVDASKYWRCFITDSVNGAYIGKRTSNNFVTGVPYCLVTTYSGSGLATGIGLYANSIRVDIVDISAGVYARMRNTNTGAMFGVARGSYLLGSETLPMIFDYEISPLQVKALGARLRRIARAA